MGGIRHLGRHDEHGVPEICYQRCEILSGFKIEVNGQEERVHRKSLQACAHYGLNRQLLTIVGIRRIPIVAS